MEETKLTILEMGAQKIAERKRTMHQDIKEKKSTLFNAKLLGVRNKKVLVNAVADYYYKEICGKEKYTDREYHKIESALEALIYVSAGLYKTKKRISDELLEDIFNDENNIREYFEKYFKETYGYIFDTPIENIIYYFTWFAIQKSLEIDFSNPEYSTLEEYREFIKKERESNE